MVVAEKLPSKQGKPQFYTC